MITINNPNNYQRRVYLISVGIAMMLFSCGDISSESTKSKIAITPIGDSKDYFINKAKPEFAEHFSVSYHKNYKVVKTNADFAIEEGEEQKQSREDVLVLVQKGTELLKLDESIQGAPVIEIPIKTAAVNVQHSESFLRELDLEDRVIAIGGLYSYNDEMRNRAVSGKLGKGGCSWHTPPDM